MLAQAAALALILAFAVAAALAEAPSGFWLIAAAMLATWAAVGVFVVRPLAIMAREVGDYGVGDAEATRAAISDARAAQDRLAREVHHRVKNNLQVISSLISIRAREVDDRDVARAYAAIQMRVGALALVHRWLFDDNAGKGVDLGALTHDLCAALQQGVSITDSIDVAITSRIERLYVAQDAAVPIAFIITEVVAAAGGRSNGAGHLQVTLVLGTENGTGRLSIASDAFAAADMFSPTATTASARIVQGMVRQLRGGMAFDDAALRYDVTFPLPEAR
jgi:two-component system, sensor histidine kinase PdtaS